MSNKIDFGLCGKCNKHIIRLGGSIEADEKLVCSECYKDHLVKVVAEVEAFRKSKCFDDVLELKNKILWLSETMGHLFDNADKSSQESVSDYDGMNQFKLQLYIIDIELNIVERELIEDYHLKGYNALRKELIQIHSRLVSYQARGDL